MTVGLLVLAPGCAKGRPRNASAEVVASPARERPLYDQGLRLARAGDLTRAEQYLALALREGEEPERTLRALMSVCIRAFRLRSALRYATPFLLAHPDDWVLRQLVASVYYALGEHERAREHLMQVVQQRPSAAEAHFLLAILLAAHVGSREAIVHYRHYLALAPAGSHAAEAHAALRFQTKARATAVRSERSPVRRRQRAR
jgi:tetratricopeptide (TPR) repeat protein